MARHPNELKTEPLKLATTPQVLRYLRALMKSGFYGKNPTEAAERLLARTLEGMVEAGKLKPRRHS